MHYFRAEATPEEQELITDLFERIILYDNQTREATVTRRADGKYVVKLTVASAKLRSDGNGEQKPVPNNDLIDIAVLGEGGKVLFVEKRRMTRPVETFEIVVSGKPVRAGIDPFQQADRRASRRQRQVALMRVVQSHPGIVYPPPSSRVSITLTSLGLGLPPPCAACFITCAMRKPRTPVWPAR